jgi:hypothetical protein
MMLNPLFENLYNQNDSEMSVFNEIDPQVQKHVKNIRRFKGYMDEIINKLPVYKRLSDKGLISIRGFVSLGEIVPGLKVDEEEEKSEFDPEGIPTEGFESLAKGLKSWKKILREHQALLSERIEVVQENLLAELSQVQDMGVGRDTEDIQQDLKDNLSMKKWVTAEPAKTNLLEF